MNIVNTKSGKVRVLGSKKEAKEFAKLIDDPNHQLGYCVYYGARPERECFRTLGGVIKWLRKHADEYLRENDIAIEREYFDKELWEKIEE